MRTCPIRNVHSCFIFAKYFPLRALMNTSPATRKTQVLYNRMDNGASERLPVADMDKESKDQETHRKLLKDQMKVRCRPKTD